MRAKKTRKNPSAFETVTEHAKGRIKTLGHMVPVRKSSDFF